MEMKHLWIVLGGLNLLQIISFIAVRKHIIRGEVGRFISVNYGQKGERIIIRGVSILPWVFVITVVADILLVNGIIKLAAMIVHTVGFAVFLSMVMTLLAKLEKDMNPRWLFAAEVATFPLGELLKMGAVSAYLIFNF